MYAPLRVDSYVIRYNIINTSGTNSRRRIIFSYDTKVNVFIIACAGGGETENKMDTAAVYVRTRS